MYRNHRPLIYSPIFPLLLALLVCGIPHAWGVPSSTAVMLGIGTDVTNVEYSPNGKWLAVVNGPMIVLFDAKTLQKKGVLLQEEENLPSGIRLMAFSPDSRSLVSLSRTRRLALWDVQTATRCSAFLHGGEPLDRFWTPVAFSPDGRLLALTSAEAPFDEILIWNILRQTVQTTIQIDGESVRSVTFHPDGEVLAAIVESGQMNTLTFWDSRTGRQLGADPVESEVVRFLTFRPDGKVLAAIVEGKGTDTLTFWDVRTGRQLGVHPEERVNSIAYSPDGRLLAASNSDNTIQLLKVESGEVLYTLKDRGDTLFSPDSKLLAIGGGDTVELWDVQTGEMHRTFAREDIISFAFSPDSQTLVMGLRLKGLEFWNVENGKLQAAIPIAVGIDANFSRDGRAVTLLTVSEIIKTETIFKGNLPVTRRISTVALKRWDPRTGAALTEDEVDLGVPWSETTKSLSPDGQLVAVGQRGSVTVWNAATGDELQTWQHPQSSFRSVVFSWDNRFVAAIESVASAQENSVIVWEVASGVEYRNFQRLRGRVLAFSPDGNTLAVGGTEGTIELRDIHTGEITQALQGHESSVASLAFSPDGRTLASGGGLRSQRSGRSDFTVRLWKVSTGDQLHVLEGRKGAIQTLAFSPDGHLLASGSGDRRVKLWLVPEGRELHTLQGYSSDVRSVTFSPDGSRLVVVAGEVLVWNLEELFGTFPPVGVESQERSPVSPTDLLPNFPNPFNPETWIPFALERDADVQISIYDAQGQLVRLLDLGHRAAGRYDRFCNAPRWDGRNDTGEAVTSGVYFYSLRAGDFRATRKMVLKK